VDILLAELFVIFNWYNPFAWLIRFSIRQNLEFIADQQVLAGGMDRKSYQYHLLEVVEVAMFYTTEDKQKHLVIRKDGTVERYGYAGGPAIKDMEEKYGPLPELMRYTSVANKGYYAQWERISMEAQKTFRTKTLGVREIIFPGDSRVIVLPAAGEPQVHDMDNADPKERPAFERLYGQLPDCVPPASISSPLDHDQAAVKAFPSVADTGRIDPHSIEAGGFDGEFYAGVKGAAAKDNARLLYLIDGVPGMIVSGTDTVLAYWH
jgi:hypothetical protein